MGPKHVGLKRQQLFCAQNYPHSDTEGKSLK